MSFFNKLGKKIEDATQTAAKKSNELVETTKINVEIKSEEDKIGKLYLEIGKKVYENCSIDDEIFKGFKEICDQIENSKTKIEKLKERALKMKNIKLCSNCNEELSKDNKYCDQCGMKQEVVEQKEEDGFITIKGDVEEGKLE